MKRQLIAAGFTLQSFEPWVKGTITTFGIYKVLFQGQAVTFEHCFDVTGCIVGDCEVESPRATSAEALQRLYRRALAQQPHRKENSHGITS